MANTYSASISYQLRLALKIYSSIKWCLKFGVLSIILTHCSSCQNLRRNMAIIFAIPTETFMRGRVLLYECHPRLIVIELHDVHFHYQLGSTGKCVVITSHWKKMMKLLIHVYQVKKRGHKSYCKDYILFFTGTIIPQCASPIVNNIAAADRLAVIVSWVARNKLQTKYESWFEVVP